MLSHHEFRAGKVQSGSAPLGRRTVPHEDRRRRGSVCDRNETGRPRSERDAAHSVRRDKGRPFFRRAIDSLMQVVTFIPII